MITNLIGKSDEDLTDIVSRRKKKFLSSGEINFKNIDVKMIFEMLREKFKHEANNIENEDGLSVNFDEWRFNLRASNTEPLLRLNVEVKGDYKFLSQKKNMLVELIEKEEYIICK